MMIEKLILALAAGIAAAKLSQDQSEALKKPVFDFITNNSEQLDIAESDKVNELEGLWLPPESATPYLYWLYKAESKHGLPENLLVRVAYQESRFRDDIISGEKISSAGAVGIMQIVPRWHPDVDPLNVPEAIDYAAAYLVRLYKSTGSWAMALAAYNWGIGNLSNKGFDAAPLETKNYVEQITGDIWGAYA